MNPRVSIGLPVYNGEAYLEEALTSILSQTYENFELIISDNASTDRTEAICRSYADADERIRYVRHEENRGVSANFNVLVSLARGEYFRWACYDDTIEPTCIERCVEVLDADPDTVLCYPRPQMIDPEGDPLDHDRFHLKSLHLRADEPHRRFRQYMQAYYPIGGKCNAVFGVMRRRMLAKTARINNYPDSDLVLLGEIALWGKFYEIQERLFNRRDHPETSVRAKPEAEERAVWLDPDNEGKIVLPRWKRLIEYARAVRRAPLSFGERVRCYNILLRHYVRHEYRTMYREGKKTMRMIWHRRGGKSASSTEETHRVRKHSNQVYEEAS